jgi:hypothetical protein
MSWWMRTRIKTRRVFSFVALAAERGIGLWRRAWTPVAYVMGWTIVAIIGVALKADVLTVLFAVVVGTTMTLAVGAFRLWDEADEARDGEGGSGIRARASLTAYGQRGVGQAPDTIRFDVSDPLKTVSLHSQHGRGNPVAIRFVKPCDRIVRRGDVPKWVRWGPPWRRSQLLIKGLSDAGLVLERVGTISDGFEIEVFHENG